MEAPAAIPGICCGIDAVLICVFCAMLPLPSKEARLTVFADKDKEGEVRYVVGGSERDDLELAMLLYRHGVQVRSGRIGWSEFTPVRVFVSEVIDDDDIRALHGMALNEQIAITFSPLTDESLATASGLVSLLGTFGTRSDWLERVGISAGTEE